MPGPNGSEGGRGAQPDIIPARLAGRALIAVHDAIAVPQQFVNENPSVERIPRTDSKDGRVWMVDLDERIPGSGNLEAIYLRELNGDERYELHGFSENIGWTDHSRGVKGTLEYYHFPQSVTEIATEAEGLLRRLFPTAPQVPIPTH